MDMRARHLLSVIRADKRWSNSIIAGGAVRDEYFELQPKDYDFFVPFDYNVLDTLTKEIGSHPVKSDKNYRYSRSLPIVDVFDWKYEGIEVQVMVTRFPNDENFTKKVMDSFDFGINKIFYEGSYVLEDTPEFQKDAKSKILTLYSLTDLKYLPKYMDRYTRINKKLGGNFTFACPNLQLVGTVPNYTENPCAEIPLPSRVARREPWQQEVVERAAERLVVERFGEVVRPVDAEEVVAWNDQAQRLADQIDHDLLNQFVRIERGPPDFDNAPQVAPREGPNMNGRADIELNRLRDQDLLRRNRLRQQARAWRQMFGRVNNQGE